MWEEGVTVAQMNGGNSNLVSVKTTLTRRNNTVRKCTEKNIRNFLIRQYSKSRIVKSYHWWNWPLCLWARLMWCCNLKRAPDIAKNDHAFYSGVCLVIVWWQKKLKKSDVLEGCKVSPGCYFLVLTLQPLCTFSLFLLLSKITLPCCKILRASPATTVLIPSVHRVVTLSDFPSSM